MFCMRFFHTIIMITIAAMISSCSNKSTVSGDCKSPEIADYPLEGGMSAPFAGFIDETLIVAGGCNFPDIPAADGGKKAYYDKSYSLNLNELKWKEQTPLNTPTAYGATAQTPYGLACIGGQSATSSLSESFLMKLDENKGTTIIDTLPQLPISIDNGGAAYLKGKIIVTGGNQSDGGKGLYALDMNNPKQWEKISDYPGPVRVQPVIISDEESLYIAGGFQLDAESKRCTLSTNLLKYSLSEDQWTELTELPMDNSGTPRCLVGGSGVYVNGCLVLTGGVNYNIFKDAVEGRSPDDYMTKPREWYKFNKDILIYNLKTGKWQTVPDVSGMDKAGGVLVCHEGNLYMVCGEIKPGIRTQEICSFLKLNETISQGHHP